MHTEGYSYSVGGHGESIHGRSLEAEFEGQTEPSRDVQAEGEKHKVFNKVRQHEANMKNFERYLESKNKKPKKGGTSTAAARTISSKNVTIQETDKSLRPSREHDIGYADILEKINEDFKYMRSRMVKLQEKQSTQEQRNEQLEREVRQS